MARNVNIKLDEVKDSDIINFIDGRNATTYLFKEAMRMYIRAYSRIDELNVSERTVSQPEPAKEEVAQSSANLKNRFSNLRGKKRPNSLD